MRSKRCSPDPARRAKMGEAARRKVLEELADGPVIAKTIAVYGGGNWSVGADRA